MVVTASVSRSGDGPRPVNLNKDIPQIVDLLQMVFGERIDIGGQRAMAQRSDISPSMLMRFNSATVRLSPGFVWLANGRIIGNVTLLASKQPQRFLVANVAVHPDYRRQGIARQLMEQVLAETRQRHGAVVMLQVVHDNTPAIQLYQSLGFTIVGTMTTWHSAVSRLRDIELSPWETGQPGIRPLAGRDWAAAYEFDRQVLDPELNWPEPISRDLYRGGFWRRSVDFVNGRQWEAWVTTDSNGKLTGLGSINSEWGRPHELRIRVANDATVQVTRTLFAKLVRRLRYLPRRNVRIEHPADDELVNQLLREANFAISRTLTHMRLELKK